MVLLVERMQDHRVGEDLVQELAADQASVLRQCDRKEPHGSEPLDLVAALVQERLTRL
jgi:hypothetical protein